ncbi:hypothetical protein BST20_25480 [Mycobacterium branderi]|nr:hypothetical protein BST20_25480 [Mycobacterium branderi]
MSTSHPGGPGPWTGAANIPARPAKPAEVAQARLFEGILQAEIAELHEIAYRMAESLDQQFETGGVAPTKHLLRIHSRIDEIHRLLNALRGRFPSARWDGEAPE